MVGKVWCWGRLGEDGGKVGWVVILIISYLLLAVEWDVVSFFFGGQNFTLKVLIFCMFFFEKMRRSDVLVASGTWHKLGNMLDAMRCGQFPTATAPWQSELDSWRIDVSGSTIDAKFMSSWFCFMLKSVSSDMCDFQFCELSCAFYMRILEPFRLWIRFEKKTTTTSTEKKHRRSVRTAVAEPQTCPFFHLLIFKNVSSCKKKSTCGRNHTFCMLGTL